MGHVVELHSPLVTAVEVIFVTGFDPELVTQTFPEESIAKPDTLPTEKTGHVAFVQDPLDAADAVISSTPVAVPTQMFPEESMAT